MNPLIKTLQSFVESLNRLIDSMSLKTVETVKRGFYLTVFIFCIIGIVIGINLGKDSARIKSEPLAEFVNDTFRIDLNREKENGDFAEMLESEMMKESPINTFDKAEFPTQERLEPEYGKDPIEAQNRIPDPDIISRPYKNDIPADEDLERKITGSEPSVKALEKTMNDENKNDIILNRSMEPEKKKGGMVKDEDKSTIRTLEKDKVTKPEIINRDTEIINQ